MDAIIKYRGGKRREIPQFIDFFPADYDTYIEPFLGGGAVFFQQEPNNAIISDINEPLINFYRQLATKYDRVMEELQALHEIYEHNEDLYSAEKIRNPELRIENGNEILYYRLRDMYNGIISSEYLPATLYYFINKTAYSGMLRFNAQGQYNVPYGRYKHFNVNIITERHRDLLQRTQILNDDFEDVFDVAQPNDFIFLDPPYDCTFHEYGNLTDDFNEVEHRRLAQAFYNLNCRALEKNIGDDQKHGSKKFNMETKLFRSSSVLGRKR